MRSLVLLVFSIVLFSCSSSNKAEDTAVEAKDTVAQEQVKAETIPVKQIKDTQALLDTVEKVVQRQLLEDSIETQFGFVFQKVLKRYTVNDSVDYILFTRNDQGCMVYFLGSVLADSLREEAEIGADCDREEGMPEYTWVEAVKDDSTGTYWLEIQSYAPDSLLNDEGELLEGVDLTDVEFTHDTVFRQYLIEPKNGSIHSVNLLEQKEL
jgi:hypothetical protein